MKKQQRRKWIQIEELPLQFWDPEPYLPNRMSYGKVCWHKEDETAKDCIHRIACDNHRARAYNLCKLSRGISYRGLCPLDLAEVAYNTIEARKKMIEKRKSRWKK